MNKAFVGLAAFIIACSGCAGQASDSIPSPDKSADTIPTETTVNQLATSQKAVANPAETALLEAYPDFISEIRDNKIIFTDGSSMVFDDGRKKDFATLLDHSDPEDMFAMKYDTSDKPAYQSDAGRSRSEGLFKKMYGSSAAEVNKKLVRVPWFGTTIRFTSANGADKQLKKVAEEIARHPELRKYVDCSGTFYWRNVRGAKRLSAHSYGIAIDIAVKNSDYWLWRNPRATESTKIAYSNRIPLELVEIFERHGFIWGGRWYHYDTMHFEYRPEIIAYKRLTESADAE